MYWASTFKQFRLLSDWLCSLETLLCRLSGKTLNTTFLCNHWCKIHGKKCDIWSKTLFLTCLTTFISEWPISAIQIRPKNVTAETSKAVHFERRLKIMSLVLQKLACDITRPCLRHAAVAWNQSSLFQWPLPRRRSWVLMVTPVSWPQYRVARVPQHAPAPRRPPRVKVWRCSLVSKHTLSAPHIRWTCLHIILGSPCWYINPVESVFVSTCRACTSAGTWARVAQVAAQPLVITPRQLRWRQRNDGTYFRHHEGFHKLTSFNLIGWSAYQLTLAFHKEHFCCHCQGVKQDLCVHLKSAFSTNRN